MKMTILHNMKLQLLVFAVGFLALFMPVRLYSPLGYALCLMAVGFGFWMAVPSPQAGFPRPEKKSLLEYVGYLCTSMTAAMGFLMAEILRYEHFGPAGWGYFFSLLAGISSLAVVIAQFSVYERQTQEVY